MDLLIKDARIIDAEGPREGNRQSLLIRDGLIEKIAPSLKAEGVPVLEGEQLAVSPGWMDFSVQVGDPGFEHRESLQSAALAAAAGGFTGILCQPNTEPAIHSKSEVRYIINNSKGQAVRLLPIGAVSRDCAGKDITEMMDMNAAGALAFSDGRNPIQNSGLMLRALQYVKAFGGLVINQPLDQGIAGGGQMHEGETSTSLGLKGIPSMAEELMVQRDLHLLEYAESRLHLSLLSTAGAVEMVRAAKKKGLQVTASVSAMNLAYDDSALASFDPNYKLLPPLRSREDREALREGLLDGTIDIITSNHVPLEEELKKKEFSYAEFGATGLETLYALCKTHLSSWLSDEMIVEKIAISPRRVLGLPLPRIETGQLAELTVFSPVLEWAYTERDVQSRSRNSPLLGQKLRGRPLAAIRNNLSFVNPYI